MDDRAIVRALRRRGRLAGLALALVVTAQGGIALFGIASHWQWGHNGFNGAAYQVAARNTLRTGSLFPVQYVTARRPARTEELYTAAPLMLHLHTTAAVALLGDHEYAVRAVPALHGVLAAVALFVVLLRHWGLGQAVVGSAVYLALPINHAFANMSNHTTGCFFWSLVMLHCHLLRAERFHTAHLGHHRTWHLTLGVFVGAFMAIQWNWPGYLVAFAVFVQWVPQSFRRSFTRHLRRVGPLCSEHLKIVAFCALVLGSFALHFALILREVGSLSLMAKAFQGRHGAPEGVWAQAWELSFEPMFSAPLLAITALGSVAMLLRLRAPRSRRRRSLVPLSFLLAAAVYSGNLPATILLHLYWPWDLNPLVAIACAELLRELTARGPRLLTRLLPFALRPQLLAAGSLALTATVYPLFFAGVFLFSAPQFALGRRTSGTFLPPEVYDSEYPKVLFARQLRAWTTPRTGVAVTPHFDRLGRAPYRIEFQGTLDRALTTTSSLDARMPPDSEARDGWVVVGRVGAGSPNQRLRHAKDHPYRQYGDYYMIDPRVAGQDVQIFNLEPTRPSWAHWFFVNAFEPPLRARRDPRAEATLREQLERLPSTSPARSDPAPTPPLRLPAVPAAPAGAIRSPAAPDGASP